MHDVVHDELEPSVHVENDVAPAPLPDPLRHADTRLHPVGVGRLGTCLRRPCIKQKPFCVFFFQQSGSITSNFGSETKLFVCPLCQCCSKGSFNTLQLLFKINLELVMCSKDKPETSVSLSAKRLGTFHHCNETDRHILPLTF